MRIPRENIRHVAAAAIFLALLCAPLAGHLFGRGQGISELERRALAALPTASDAAADPTALPEKVSRWMEDHVGFRLPLIRLYVKAREELKLKDERFAVRGEDGWLFSSLNDELLSHQGLDPYQPGEAEAWIAALRSIRDASCGKPFAVLIAPNKMTIYPEFLPNHPRRARGLTRLETLEQVAQDSDIALSIPRRALMRAKSEGPVYYKTDTHWTPLGAYHGYAALMDALARQGLAASTMPRDNLLEMGERTHQGDIYGLLGVENGAPETLPAYSIHNAAPILSETRIADLSWREFDATRFITAPAGRPRLLLYGDSFAYGLLPFLRESFSEVVFVPHRNVNLPLSALKECQYDAVALEIVERSLTLMMRPTPAEAD